MTKSQKTKEIRQRNIAWRLGRAEAEMDIAMTALSNAAGYLNGTAYCHHSKAIHIVRDNELNHVYQAVIDASTEFIESGKEPKK